MLGRTCEIGQEIKICHDSCPGQATVSLKRQVSGINVWFVMAMPNMIFSIPQCGQRHKDCPSEGQGHCSVSIVMEENHSSLHILIHIYEHNLSTIFRDLMITGGGQAQPRFSGENLGVSLGELLPTLITTDL